MKRDRNDSPDIKIADHKRRARRPAFVGEDSTNEASSNDQVTHTPPNLYGIHRYKRYEKIGEGSYGAVFRAVDLVTQQRVAMKRLGIDSSEGIPSTSLREIALLRQLNHPNVVKVLDVFVDHGKSVIWLVLEYMDLDLGTAISNFKEQLDLRMVRSIVQQILRGLVHCHSHRVFHRDIKPQNILIDVEGHVKLADFGLSRLFDLPIRQYTHEVETQWYRAPEVLFGETHYTPAIDVWSVGCIMYEIACRQPLFPGDTEIDQIYKICRTLGTPTEATWPGITRLRDYRSFIPIWPAKSMQRLCPQLGDAGRDLLKKMLVLDPRARIKPDEALNHPFFQSIGDPLSSPGRHNVARIPSSAEDPTRPLARTAVNDRRICRAENVVRPLNVSEDTNASPASKSNAPFGKPDTHEDQNDPSQD